MPDLADGETAEVQGSARLPYALKNVAGVYSCSCPAWRNQSLPIDGRTCKHLKSFRGAEAEAARIGQATTATDTDVNLSQPKPTPPRLLLARTWTADVDPSGWLLSEKLDGVRAYWDGKNYYSRQGNPFYAPDWFVEHLPTIPLDGELWIGRKAFSRTVSIVRRHDRSRRWDEITFVVFDAAQFAVGTGFTDAQRTTPPPIGSTITFRYQELTDRGVPRFPSFVRAGADAELPLLDAGRTDE